MTLDLDSSRIDTDNIYVNSTHLTQSLNSSGFGTDYDYRTTIKFAIYGYQNVNLPDGEMKGEHLGFIFGSNSIEGVAAISEFSIDVPNPAGCALLSLAVAGFAFRSRMA